MKKKILCLLSAVYVLLILVFIFKKETVENVNSNQIVTTPVIPKITVIPTIAKNIPNQSINVQFEKDKLEKYLTVEAALLGVVDNISLYYKEFNNDILISIDPTRSWIPASTIKSFVVLEAFRQRRLGIINFDQNITITADNVVPTELETDNYTRLREGVSVTIKQLIGAMIIQSDNTAYNTLLDVLDRRNINSTLKNLGLTETVVGEKLNLDDSQFQKDLQIPGRQSNTTTVKDYTSFFDLLYNKKFPDYQEILDIFKKQKINNMIPALLPENTIVAHKTGDLAPIYHDGGVIYKPNEPFILAVFSNSNDPSILSKLAQVAFYKDAKVVGLNLNQKKSLTFENKTKKIYLAGNSFKNVLGVKDQNIKFPKVTAADLGITGKDLSIDKQEAKNIRPAFLIPGGILYDIKRYFEDLHLKKAKTNAEKLAIYLGQSKTRLSEVKALLQAGQIKDIDLLLGQSEENLKAAEDIVKKDLSVEVDLYQIKYINDLHFAILAENSSKIHDNYKEEFIDSVYRFYKKNNAEVIPALRNSINVNPFEQQPIVGTIDKVSHNTVTVKFEDGTTKDILITDSTRVRSFHKENLDDKNSLTPGSKIAILGQVTKKGKKASLFILKDIPKELPDKKEGIITEINTQNNTLKIKDTEGKQINVKIEQDTVIRGRDTGVSLEGIKAGSSVTVFGEIEKQTNEQKNQSNQNTKSEQTEIKANTVTVINNNSGSSENKTSPPSGSSSKENKKDNEKKEDKKEEQKKDDSSKSNDKKSRDEKK